jgi:Flp pilus assembly protein TadD
VRDTGFIHHRELRASAARWILLAALSAAATSCSSLPSIPNPLSGVGAAMTGLPGKVADMLPGHVSDSDKAASRDLVAAGDAAREKGDLDAAATDYAQAVGIDPSSLDAQLRLGAISLARKDNTAAVAAYQAAQNLAPNDPEAAFRLGELDLTRGDAKAASDQFTVALATRKDDAKLYNAMGVSLSMQSKYDLAKQNFDQGLAIEPDYPALRNNYGLMQLASGDLKGALDTFSTLVASPQATDRYRFNRALVELAMGETEAALADAPGMDEPGLRQTLATYLAPSQADSIRAKAERIGKVLVGGSATAARAEPPVHLAVQLPTTDAVTIDTAAETQPKTAAVAATVVDTPLAAPDAADKPADPDKPVALLSSGDAPETARPPQ